MKQIQTDQAPAAIGPYSQAMKTGGMVYCSGQIALDPETMQITEESVADQTRRVFQNLEAVLIAGGSGLDQVVRCTVYLQSMNDFAKMNSVYESAFAGHKPARITVEVARLPKDALVEISCIAEANQ